MQETQNGLNLLGGRAGLLECVYKDKSGFDYSFSLDGQILNVRSLQSPLLPVNAGDEMLAVCDKKGRVLGLKNRSLNSAVWYAYEPSSFFSALFFVLFLLFAAAGVWAIFSGFDGRQPLFGTLLLVFGFGSLAFAWFKYHGEASLGLRVRLMLGVAKEPKSSGEASGAVRDLRIFEAKEKNYFSVTIGDTFLWGSSPKKRALELENGDEASVKYENFRVIKIRNLSKNLTAKKSQGFFERVLWFNVDIAISLCAGLVLLYAGTMDFWFSPFAGIAGLIILLGGVCFNVFYKKD
ncbi:putative membrane protein [Campylobacter showae]|uniref:Uncharacterized protein n=1 Tax=Campylobacter showae RM3277 TaxID=553219 RepID=C6RFZ7_9BACT|nr:hypothetical protein [Campylobacter showae]EET79692.1 hypothetical protein CAMSH0001_2260 [Campylobacter showae RM3277]QCD48554.1 putative membrane protein [Campylobacter showae]